MDGKMLRLLYQSWMKGRGIPGVEMDVALGTALRLLLAAQTSLAAQMSLFAQMHLAVPVEI